MTPQTALNVLNQAAAKFLGTLEDHNTLQEAAKVLEDFITKTEQEKSAPDAPAEPTEIPVVVHQDDATETA